MKFSSAAKKKSEKKAINNEGKKTTKKLAKKKLQKAFLCSTLMKSYAFVIMLLPSCSFFCYWETWNLWETKEQDACGWKVNLHGPTEEEEQQQPLERRYAINWVGKK